MIYNLVNRICLLKKVNGCYYVVGLETVEEPRFNGNLLICKLCEHRHKEMSEYYTHVFFIHNDEEARAAVKLKFETEQAKRPFAFCPEKGCSVKNESFQELSFHYAIKHAYLEALLKSQNRLGMLEKRERSLDPVVPSYLPQTVVPQLKKVPDDLSQKSQKAEDVAVREGEEWRTVEVCPICTKTISQSHFQRKAHFLDHFKSNFQEYMKQKFPINLVTRNCCNKLFTDDQTFFMHFGTEHGLYDHFLKERRRAPHFNNEFLQFLGRGSTPQAPKQQKTGPKKSGENCKLCDKIFEEYSSSGERRPTSVVANVRFEHYLSHYRDVLLQTHPRSFSNQTPLNCSKCSYSTSHLTSTRKNDHNEAMLNHIAKCYGELEALIQKAKPRQVLIVKNPQAQVVVENIARASDKKLEWDKVDSCLICKDDQTFSDRERRIHYTRHVMEEMKVICKDLQPNVKTLETVSCPICKIKIIRDNSVSLEDFLCMFFMHIGFVHHLIPKLFLHENVVRIFDYSSVDMKKTINDCFWAIKAGSCLICKSDLSPNTKSERINHYTDHLSSLVEIFGKKRSHSCYRCQLKLPTVEKYKLHVLNEHLNNKLMKSIKLRLDGELQCGHCKKSSPESFEIVDHLINEELFLDVEILADMADNSQSPDVQSTQRLEEKAEAQEDYVECQLCRKFLKGEEFFKKHLYVKHFKNEIDSKIPTYFDNLTDDSLSQKCNVCHKTVKRREMGGHLALEHEDVHRSYLQVVSKPTKEDEMLDQDNCNELTTLGEQVEDIEEVEKEMKKFLKGMQKSQETFIQNAPCYMFADRLPPCHECKKIQQGANYALSGTCCCFEGFRKIRFIEDGRLIIVGYLDPKGDSRTTDVDIWASKPELPVDDMEEEDAFFIIKKVGDLLCDIINDEKLMRQEFESSNRCVVWKRPHQGVREMCDVCSTTIFNLHFTCSRCGVLVCCDCFLARKRGTKYKSINAVTKPTRTRKRFRSGLDMNLWPLCLNNQIHDIDKLIMTQMSPEQVPEELLSDIHSIRSFYNLDARCKCCSPDRALGHDATPETDSRFSVGIFQTCPACFVTFQKVSANCIRIHLANHIKLLIIGDNTDNVCSECNLDTRNSNNFLSHQALVHFASDKHFGEIFLQEEAQRQDEINLEIDLHVSCKICKKVISDLNKAEKRNHYILHLAEHILSKTKVVQPFSCEACNHTEFNRNRLMIHIGIIHKEVDAALTQYMTEETNSSMKTITSWEDIPNCVFCNERHDNQTVSYRRNHYLMMHLKASIEKQINEEYDNILIKKPPYRCRRQGCDFVVDGTSCKNRFIMHMSGKHRMVDTYLIEVTKTMIQNVPSEPNDELFGVFSGKCQICDEELDSSDSPDALKAAKAHYHIHFKDSIEERYEDVFAEHKIPFHCPYEGCQFNTEDFESDQFGHHKKKLVKHLGSFHDLFKKFVEQGVSSKKNFEMSQRFAEDKKCKICNDVLDADFEQKAMHFHNHFKLEIEKEFEKEIFGDSLFLNCPFCDTISSSQIKEEAFVQIGIHIGINHGVFDRKIGDYTRTLDYNKETSCRVCSKDFTLALAKSTALKKHYASHFSGVIEEMFPDLEDGTCPICSNRIISREAMIIHIGNNHGYFCRLIEKHHWKEEEEEVIDDNLNQTEEVQKIYSVHAGEAKSLCILCGFTIKIPDSEELEAYLNQRMKLHLFSHVSHLIPESEERKCADCGQVFKQRVDFDTHMISHSFYLKVLQKMLSPSKPFTVEDVSNYFMAEKPEYDHIKYIEECDPITDVSVQEQEDSAPAAEKEMKVAFHERLNNCPICKSNFSSIDNLGVQLHLTRHFAKLLAERLPLKSPLKCPSCPIVLENRFTLLVHFSVAHNTIDEIAQSELKNLEYLPEESQERTDRSSINRFTLPKNGNRYKSICLMCGNDDVRLASIDRLSLEADNSKEMILNNGLGLHLLKKHLMEFFPDLTSSSKFCSDCKEHFRNEDSIINHFVSNHAGQVMKVLRKVLFVSEDKAKDISYSDLFVGYENKGFIDTLLLDMDIVNNTGAVVSSDTVIAASSQDISSSFINNASTNLLELDQEVKNTPADSNGWKRKSVSADREVSKKLKVDGEDLIQTRGYDRAVQCDICNVYISPKREAEHVIKHVESDLREGLVPGDKTCSTCDQTFDTSNSLIEHIGIVHNFAMSIYKKLAVHTLASKKKQFYDQLGKKVPSNCELCGLRIVKGSVHISSVYWRHLQKEHSELFTIMQVQGCHDCKIYIDGQTSTFCHYYVEHNDAFDDIIKAKITEEWKTLGKPICELCKPSKEFLYPSLKRAHLVEAHFKEFLSNQLKHLTNTTWTCPSPDCNYKSSVPLETLSHWGITHKAVDQLLPGKIMEMAKNVKDVEAVKAVMCPLCSEPVECLDTNQHLLTHFFSLYMAPKIALVKCPEEKCTHASSNQTGHIYGNVLTHIGEKHFGSVLDSFMEPSIRNMLQTPVNYLELKLLMYDLLRGKICIYCLQQFPNAALLHLQQHALVSSNTLMPAEDPYQCDFCDGFPSFDTIQDLRTHNVKEHWNLQKELKVLSMIERIDEKRSSMMIDPKSFRKQGLTYSAASSTGRNVAKRAKRTCRFSTCNGYYEDEYYSHMVTHFWDPLINDLSKEKEKSKDLLPLSCPR